MSRFLVTTPWEPAWPHGAEDVLLLGEWCLSGDGRPAGGASRWEVVTHPWADRSRLVADRHYLEEAYERALVDLADALNQVHGLDNSVRSWRIVVGPWLRTFVVALYDRWSLVHRALEDYGAEQSVVLREDGPRVPPARLSTFRRECVAGERWNHEICGDVLRARGGCDLVEVEVDPGQRPGRVEPGRSVLGGPGPVGSARVMARRLITDLFARLSCDDEVFVFNSFLGRWGEADLLGRMGQLPVDWHAGIRSTEPPVPPRPRGWAMGGEPGDRFDEFLRGAVPQHIPAAYVEDRARILRKAADLRWPSRPRAIVTGMVHSNSDLFRTWAAERVEDGASLIGCQHGGTYGMSASFGVEKHEMAVVDRFVTWGWDDPDDPVPVAVGQIPRVDAVPDPPPGGGVLVALDSALPMVDSADDLMVSPLYGRYLESVARFVDSLDEDVRRAVVIRCYPVDWSRDQLSWCRRRLPGINVDEGTGSLVQAMVGCRVFVGTYNSTTYLQALSMGRPTVCFWDPVTWSVRPQAAPFLDGLRDVGILHDSPESAARLLSGAWGRLGPWWEGIAASGELARFRDRYCRSVADPVSGVVGVVRDQLGGSEATGRRGLRRLLGVAIHRGLSRRVGGAGGA